MARCSHSQSSCLATAVRSNNQPLFPSLSEGKRYYFRVEVDDQIGSSSIDSDVRFQWNQVPPPYESQVTSICTILPIILLMSSQKTYPHVNSQTSTNSYLLTMSTSVQWPPQQMVHSFTIILSSIEQPPLRNTNSHQSKLQTTKITSSLWPVYQ